MAGQQDRLRERLARMLPWLTAAAVLAGLSRWLTLPFYWDAMFNVKAAKFYLNAPLGVVYPPNYSHFAHPPLWLYIGAGMWKLTGHPVIALRISSFLAAGATLILTGRLARRLLGTSWGAVPPLLLAATPMFLAQTAMAYNEVPVALFTLVALTLALEERRVLLVAAAVGLALMKGTAGLGVPAVLAAVVLTQGTARAKRLGCAAVIALSTAAALLFWFWLHSTVSGWWIVAPGRAFHRESLFSLDAASVLFAAQGRWLLAGAAGLALLLHKVRRGRNPAVPNADLIAHLAVVLAYLLGFGLLETLPRYLIPALPSFYILMTACLRLAGPRIGGASLLAAVCLSLYFCWRGGTQACGHDDTLEFTHRVRLAQQVEAFLRRTASADALIITDWPYTDLLQDPDVGYLTGSPWAVFNLRTNQDLVERNWQIVQEGLATGEHEVWVLVEPDGYGEYLSQFCRANSLSQEAELMQGGFSVEIYRIRGPLAHRP